MSNLSNTSHKVLAKAFTAMTSVTTVLSLSGVMYLAPVALAVAPADYGLKEGDVVSAAGSDDPDVYIVNEMGYKRLFLNPAIFNFYGHLGGFGAVKNVSPATRDAFGTSGLFRNCETNDEKVYGVETTGEDTGMLHWVNTPGSQAVVDDPNFFKKVFCINSSEFSWYSQGTAYTSVNQVPSYSRVAGATPVPAGPLSVMLAPGNPTGVTITKNAIGAEMLRVRVNGTGTLNTLTIKRLGAGQTDDFGNVYLYDGAKRLTSGKSFSSSSGELTFLLNLAVSGSKDLSVVADMSADNTTGNVNYLQLTNVTATGGAVVSGTPLSGNNFTTSGASSGTVTVTKTGSLSNPTVGQKGAQISEFKHSVDTEGGTVKRVTMINGGTLKPADLTNVKIKTGSNEWPGVVTSDGYLVFDFGSGFFIAKGGNATFKVYGDTGGKKDETVDLYFENDTDTNVVGDQYGQGMAVTDTSLDAGSDVTDLTLQGGALTLVFNGPTASTVGTTATDVTLLRYSVTAASNIEIKKTEFTLCADQAGDGTYDTETTEADWDDVTDFKVWDEGTNNVVIGPKDGTAFDHADDTTSCPAGGGVQESFTDALDLAAGKTYNFKVTADINTGNVAAELIDGSIIRAILDDYSDDAGDVTVAKYTGTNTAVAAADVVPRADINGPDITLSASSLTLSLSGTPADQTKIRGTKNVDAVGITFAASQASALKVTTIKITGYAADTTTYDEGVEDGGNAVSVSSAMAKVQLYESGTNTLIAGTDKVSSNLLGTSGTGTMTFSNLDWNIPAGTSKTMLVRVDLSNNQASGTAGDLYAFDIAATGDVTSLDSDSNTVNPGSAAKNGVVLSPTQVLTVKNGGSMTLAQSADSAQKGSIYWGQQNAPISKFRLSATDEGQFIEKLTIGASDSTEITNAKNNVNDVLLTYKNKAGSTLTTSQAMGNGASVNFAWSAGDANRPFVPQDSTMEISVNANMKTKEQGATPTNASPGSILFSLDLLDKFNGSYTNGFRAVGDGSGTVLDGTSTNIADVLGANDQYVYRVYPKIEQVALASPYNLSGTPTVFKFSITAMGLADAFLRFDNQSVGSGSIKFEIVASGEHTGANATSTTYTIYDESNVTIDTSSSSGESLGTSRNASLSFNFSSKDVEIAGGGTKTFRVQIDNPSTYYAKTSSTGRAADYFQLTLLDNEAGLLNWVADYNNTVNAVDTASVVGTLRSLPLYGPTFQR